MKTYLLRKTVGEILFAMKDFFLRGKNYPQGNPSRQEWFIRQGKRSAENWLLLPKKHPVREVQPHKLHDLPLLPT